MSKHGVHVCLNHYIITDKDSKCVHQQNNYAQAGDIRHTVDTQLALSQGLVSYDIVHQVAV